MADRSSPDGPIDAPALGPTCEFLASKKETNSETSSGTSASQGKERVTAVRWAVGPIACRGQVVENEEDRSQLAGWLELFKQGTPPGEWDRDFINSFPKSTASSNAKKQIEIKN